MFLVTRVLARLVVAIWIAVFYEVGVRWLVAPHVLPVKQRALRPYGVGDEGDALPIVGKGVKGLVQSECDESAGIEEVTMFLGEISHIVVRRGNAEA